MNKLSIIVLAFNEVESLERTILDINSLVKDPSLDILISTSKHASELCQIKALELEKRFSSVRVFYQRKPYVAAAVMEALETVESQYVIYMSADGETPATLIPALLSSIEDRDVDIVSASRWISSGSFTDYGKAKYVLSLCAQILCKVVYLSRLTEFTYGFRIYKTSVLKSIRVREKKHPFFLESLLVPLRLGYSIVEIPVKWVPRVEGESVVDIKTLLSYLRPVFRIRFTRKSRFRDA